MRTRNSFAENTSNSPPLHLCTFPTNTHYSKLTHTSSAHAHRKIAPFCRSAASYLRSTWEAPAFWRWWSTRIRCCLRSRERERDWVGTSSCFQILYSNRTKRLFLADACFDFLKTNGRLWKWTRCRKDRFSLGSYFSFVDKMICSLLLRASVGALDGKRSVLKWWLGILRFGTILPTQS